MKRLVVCAALALAIPMSEAKADGLFMGLSWSSAPAAPRSRSEDTIGVAAGKNMIPSVQVPSYGPRYAGRTDFTSVCDQFQSTSEQSEGMAAYYNGRRTDALYPPTSVNCGYVYYPGFTFFFGAPNMALAPHYQGGPFTAQQRVFPDSGYGTDFWGNPRY